VPSHTGRGRGVSPPSTRCRYAGLSVDVDYDTSLHRYPALVAAAIRLQDQGHPGRCTSTGIRRRLDDLVRLAARPAASPWIEGLRPRRKGGGPFADQGRSGSFRNLRMLSRSIRPRIWGAIGDGRCG